MAIGSNMLSHLIHDLSFALNLFACSDLLDSNKLCSYEHAIDLSLGLYMLDLFPCYTEFWN
jgi:hypothetical protein